MTQDPGLQLDRIDETALRQLAEQLAPRLDAGDFVGLYGELGAGKTAFARYLIRALTGRADEEVPSPSFTLVQPYDTPRYPVHHFDFYRLSEASEAHELGFEEACEAGLVIAEWPERLGSEIPAARLEIMIEDCGEADRRRVTLRGTEKWTARLERLKTVMGFIEQAGWADAKPLHINSDASTRNYTRLRASCRTALLMDSPRMPDGPPIRDGKPYSRIAHLAENVVPFMAVAAALRDAGLAAPEILAQDVEAGLLLIEDFGDLTFTRLAAEGKDPHPLYSLAVDALLALRKAPPAQTLRAGPSSHELPDYDKGALAIETELLMGWFLPSLTGRDTSGEVRETFAALWEQQFDWLLDQPPGWVLRDFHSPNLILRPEETGLARLGIIDFQDAMRGHPAYDLASLLQDARLDLPKNLEDELLFYYCAQAAADPQFDQADFLRAYRILGAQRATKILGLFARLARRDGKHAYLKHLPRIAKYLWTNLRTPGLADLKSWYEREIPDDMSRLTGSA